MLYHTVLQLTVICLKNLINISKSYFDQNIFTINNKKTTVYNVPTIKFLYNLIKIIKKKHHFKAKQTTLAIVSSINSLEILLFFSLYFL